MQGDEKKPGFFGSIAGVLGNAARAMGSLFSRSAAGHVPTATHAPPLPAAEHAPKAQPEERKPHSLSGFDVEEPRAAAGHGDAGEAQSAQAAHGGIEGFLHNHEVYSGFRSSNVSAIRYDPKDNYLEIGYKNGGWYGYHDVTSREARSLYGASSKGSWVWDHLRVKGTVFGYQKPYAYIGSLSQGYEPKYYASNKHLEQHRKILPSGHVPKAWLGEKGPYYNPETGENWAEKAAPHPKHEQHPMTGGSPHPEAAKHPMGDQAGKGGKYAERYHQTSGESRRKMGEIISRKLPLAIASERAMRDALASHGKAQHKAEGGPIAEAPGIPADKDEVPVKATAGEFIVKKDEAQKPEVKQLLQEVNAGQVDSRSIMQMLSGGWDWLKNSRGFRYAKQAARTGVAAASIWSAAAGGLPSAAAMTQAAEPFQPPPTAATLSGNYFGRMRRREFEGLGQVIRQEQEHHAQGGEVGVAAAPPEPAMAAAEPDAPHFAKGGVVDNVLSEVKRGGGVSGSVAAAAQGGGWRDILGSYFAGGDGLMGSFGRAMSGTSPKAIAERAASSAGTGQGAGAGLGDAATALKDAARQLAQAATQIAASAKGGARASANAEPSTAATPWAQDAGTYPLAGESKWDQNAGAYPLADEKPKNAVATPKVPGNDILGKVADLGGEGGAGGEAGAMGGAEAAGGAAAGGEGAMAAGAAGGPIGIAVVAAVGIVKGAFDTFVDLSKKYMDPANTIRSAVSPVQSQVAAYNPGAVQRFNLAMDNLSASVGRWFQPIIDGATRFGDALNVLNTAMGGEAQGFVKSIVDPLVDMAIDASRMFLGAWRGIMDFTRPVREALSPLASTFAEATRIGGEIGGLFRDIYQATKPIIDVLFPFESGVNLAVRALQEFVAQLAAAAAAARESYAISARRGEALSQGYAQGGVRGFLGAAGESVNVPQLMQEIGDVGRSAANAYNESLANMRNGRRNENGGPMTVAAQQSRFVSIEEVGMNARQAAFGSGRATPPTGAQVDRINNQVSTMVGLMQRLAENLQQQGLTSLINGALAFAQANADNP